MDAFALIYHHTKDSSSIIALYSSGSQAQGDADLLNDIVTMASRLSIDCLFPIRDISFRHYSVNRVSIPINDSEISALVFSK